MSLFCTANLSNVPETLHDVASIIRARKAFLAAVLSLSLSLTLQLAQRNTDMSTTLA